MNANLIITEEMTLEEKLAAIDAAMVVAQEKFNVENGRDIQAPVDPSDLLICDSCQ